MTTKKRKRRPKFSGYVDHGVALRAASNGQARGPCPLCFSTSRDPFCVDEATLIWNCQACGAKGNLFDFLEEKMPKYRAAFRGQSVIALEGNRGIPRATLRAWGVGWNAASNYYMLPHYSGGRIVNVRFWRTGHTFVTLGGKGGIIAPSSGARVSADTVWVCEGEWDTMTVDFALRTVGLPDDVRGVPGASHLPTELRSVLVDRHVVLAYDKDKGGREALLKAAKALEHQSASLLYVNWPEDKPDKYDMRDLWRDCDYDPEAFLVAARALTAPATQALKPLLDVQLGAEIVDGPPPLIEDVAKPQPTGPGLPYDEMVAGFREWLHLPDPKILDVLFGAIFANRLGGDPVWLFIVGPGGSGKSEPIISTYGAPLISPETTMTPSALVSGAKVDPDPSMIPVYKGTVVAFKDFTPILMMPPMDRDQIFSILRDAFDGRIDKKFGNGVRRTYRDCQFGIIAGVTPEIERFSNTQTLVGERFLKFRLRQHLQVGAGRIEIDTAIRTVDKRQESVMREELREVARRTIDRSVGDPPKLGDGMRSLFVQLAQWTATCRGAVSRDRFTKLLDYAPTAEIGTRLGKQLSKLAMGVAILRDKDSVGLDEFRLMVRVAKDCVPDLMEKVVRHLYLHRADGFVAVKDLVKWTHIPDRTLTALLENGVLLKITRKERVDFSPRWSLTLSLLKLMEPLDLYATESRRRAK
jgi:hypothetical protein